MSRTFKIIIFLFFLAIAPNLAKAATLSFSPSSGSYGIGSSFSVSLYVGSADQAMNAADGVIIFPKDLLTVTSLSKGGSIISIWVQEPLYSNTNGTINFEGIVPNPGFIGASGKIITLTFKVKAAGTATLAVSSPSILANDGSGTEIFSGAGRATFTLNQTTAAPPPPPAALGLPPLPEVSSSTHPDQSLWYPLSDAKFLWSLPSDITAVRLLYDESSHSQPTVIYEVPIAEKSIPGISEGSHYLHVQFQNKKGWGPIADFHFQIDQTPPEDFAIGFNPGAIPGGTPSAATFNTTDSLSGIDYYQIQIDGKDYSKVAASAGGNSFTIPQDLSSGTHVISVLAFDKASNHIGSQNEFTVVPTRPTLTLYSPFMFNILLLVIFLLLCLMIYFWYKYAHLKKLLHNNAADTESVVHKTFDILKEDTAGAAKSGAAQQLVQDLDEGEKFIKKELKSIGKKKSKK